MNKEHAISLFGSVTALAEALGIQRQAIYQWSERVPELREYQIRELLVERERAETA